MMDLLPEGLWVREFPVDGDREPTRYRREPGETGRWVITGRNPDFWWDIVITRRHAEGEVFRLLCTRCGGGDLAASMDDMLRLIGAGAHLHDVNPDGDQV
jgi:hypothetical protein